MSTTQKYRCLACSHVYDPAEGDPDSGIPPGTPFEALPTRLDVPGLRYTSAEGRFIGSAARAESFDSVASDRR